MIAQCLIEIGGVVIGELLRLLTDRERYAFLYALCIFRQPHTNLASFLISDSFYMPLLVRTRPQHPSKHLYDERHLLGAEGV